MATSAGSDIFALLAFLTICGIVLLLLRHYLPLRSTPAFLTTPIFLALALPTTAIVLLPIDLATSARTEDEESKGIWLPAKAVLVSWRIIYWLTFVLTWAVLPFIAEYMDAGYKDHQARIIYSLRSNGRYQLTMLACGVAGLIYMTMAYKFDFTAIKGMIMALAYVWGLILAIYLMGHGLVAVPRRFIMNANVAERLRRVQSHAPRVNGKLEDAVIVLEELGTQIEQLKYRKTGTARDSQEWIDELVELASQTPSRVTIATPDFNTINKVPAVITERYLADLTRRFARARHQRGRYVEEWDQIVRRASDLQTILDSKANKRLSFGRPSPASSFLARYSVLTPYLRYHLYVHVIPAFSLLTGAILALASIAVIQSEIIRFPAPQLSIVSLTVIHHPSSKNYQIGLGGQFLAALWIMYMVFCALSSMTTIPTWNQRSLVRRNTYAESACWYAGQIAKLTVPLAYNFLTFLPKDIHKETTFYQFLGRLINLTPLGTWFDYLFPMFILLPVCATLFNLYGKIKRVFGFGMIDFEDADEESYSSSTRGWREGRDLIARDLAGHHTSSYHSNNMDLGLTDSTRSSIDNNRSSTRTMPTLWVPPSQQQQQQHQQSSRTAMSASTSGPSTRSNRTRNAVILDPEPDEENFFTLFGRRVKNTFEGIETPRWMQNENNNNGNQQSTSSSNNQLGFKRPKWMGGDDNNSSPDFIDRIFNKGRGGQNGDSSGGGGGGRGSGQIIL